MRHPRQVRGAAVELAAGSSCSSAEQDHQDGRRRKSPFAPIEDAIEAIRDGEMIIVVDDEDRENEGDLTIAAEKVTPEAINFMATHGRGLICVPMTEERLTELDMPQMVAKNTARSRRRSASRSRRRA